MYFIKKERIQGPRSGIKLQVVSQGFSVSKAFLNIAVVVVFGSVGKVLKIVHPTTPALFFPAKVVRYNFLQLS